MGLLYQAPVRSDSDSFLGIGPMRELPTRSPPSMAARLLAFIATVVLRLLVSKATLKRGRGDGNRAS